MVESAYNDIARLQESLKIAINMFKAGDNLDNEYLPITEIKDVIELLKVSENKLFKFIK